MTRIKHAEWAYEYIRQAEALFDPNEPGTSDDDATVAELTAIGQVHATLALMEQQRIANLIAFHALAVTQNHQGHLLDKDGWAQVDGVRDQIQEGLGL